MSITAHHDPLYDARPHTSTITATATGPRRAIRDVEIDVIVGDITACTELGLLPSVWPCRANAMAQAWHCPLGETTCDVALTLGNHSLVTYTATATGRRGKTVTTGPITYAAGASLTEASIQLGAPDFTTVAVPWEVARPIWWHTASPPGQKATDHLNVGFFPDATDFTGNYLGFTTVLDAIVGAAHFNSTDAFASVYSTYSSIFDLWAGPPAGATGTGIPKCTAAFATPAAAVADPMDGKVVVHDTFFRDCANFAGKWGTVFDRAVTPTGAPVRPPELYMHESGHFLHFLGDEYGCDGGYAPLSDPANVFASEDDCQKAAAKEALDKTQCKEIVDENLGTKCGTPHWRLDDGQPDIMVTDIDLAANWRGFSGRVVIGHFIACLSGACY